MDDDLLTLVNIVRSMRNLQKAYSKTRDYNTLQDSRRQEALVDKFIKRFDESFQRERDSEVMGPELPF